MKIKVCSKQQFKEILCQNNITSSNVETLKDYIFIEINDSNKISYFNKNLKNVLILYFDDIVFKENNKKLFDIYQAKQIINFVKENINKENLIIRCEADVSRSGAVYLFINDMLKQDYYEFKNLNKQILSNNHVYTTLKKVYNE
jgi:predicted protein tyrosine phosphatase